MSQDLLAAAAELRHLLGRGYPRTRCLGLVGDRHALDAAQRELLARGVFAPAAAARRRRRLLGPEACAGRLVALDGHNQLLTLETALAGGRLLWADDGVVRDIARAARSHRPGPRTLAAAGLLLAALTGAAGVMFFLDAPLCNSGQLAADLRALLAQRGMAGDAAAVPAPDRELIAHPGPVASGDSAVIDRVTQPLDLAGEIILAMNPRPALESLA